MLNYIYLFFIIHIKNPILRFVNKHILHSELTTNGERLRDYCYKIVEDKDFVPTTLTDQKFENILKETVEEGGFSSRVEAAVYLGLVLEQY